MDAIVISGVPPWDGEYDFDLNGAELTTREWGWIKRLTGYLPMTVGDGFDGGDPELFSCFAVIALHRVGRIQPTEAQMVFDRIADAPFGSTVTLKIGDQDEAEGDAGPPDLSSTSSADISGDGSPPSSEIWPSRRNGSGIHESDTSVLPPTRSAT
jgi:hypothetical protein